MQKVAEGVSLDETSLNSHHHTGVVGHYMELGIAMAADSLAPQNHHN